MHDRRFHALSGMGAALRGGRWNLQGVRLVYACFSYESTLLEALARAEIRSVPVGHATSRIVLPEECEVPVLSEEEHPDWHREGRSREIGNSWIDSRRSVALEVPSFVARPWGRNVLLNPSHPDFGRLRVAEVVDVRWDPRLF